MTFADYCVIAVIGLVMAGAVAAIVWHKRRGRKCIGCPNSGSCGGCSGNCGKCGMK